MDVSYKMIFFIFKSTQILREVKSLFSKLYNCFTKLSNMQQMLFEICDIL